MALTLSQTQVLNNLAKLLYSFLPGKAHPFADQSISFEGIAISLGLGQFWPGGSKLPAITKLLADTLQNQDSSFCPLILEVVRRGMSYRQNKGSPINREEIDTLNEIVAEVGFKIPELYDRKFLSDLPRESQETLETEDLPDSLFQELTEKLINLNSLPPQKRGFEFEKFVKDLFEAFKLAPRSSFRLVGEQIDGSFQFQDETYLVEATWQNEKVGEGKLLTFYGKVGGKAQWSRGLLISVSGFSTDGLEAFARGKPTNIICMDGYDLYSILKNKLNLCTVLAQKVRRAAETNQAFVPVRDLFPKVT